MAYNSSGDGLVTNCRGAARQSVANVEPDGVLKCILGSARRNEPGIPQEVGVLQKRRYLPVFGIAEKSLVPAASDFLCGAILAVRRSRIAVANKRGSVGIQGRVAADEDSAIIGIENRLAQRPFKTVHGGTGVDRRGGAVGAENEIGRLAVQVPARAVAPEVIGNQPEIFEDLEVAVDGAAASVLVEVSLCSQRWDRRRFC